MKVFAMSRDGNYIKLGESNENATWYLINQNVKPYTKRISRGSQVIITSSKRKDTSGKNINVLTSIKLASNNTPVNQSEPSAETNTEESSSGKENIARQAIMKATCNAVTSMVSQFSTKEELADTIEYLFDRIYKKYKTV